MAYSDSWLSNPSHQLSIGSALELTNSMLGSYTIFTYRHLQRWWSPRQLHASSQQRPVAPAPETQPRHRLHLHICRQRRNHERRSCYAKQSLCHCYSAIRASIATSTERRGGPGQQACSRNNVREQRDGCFGADAAQLVAASHGCILVPCWRQLLANGEPFRQSASHNGTLLPKSSMGAEVAVGKCSAQVLQHPANGRGTEGSAIRIMDSALTYGTLRAWDRGSLRTRVRLGVCTTVLRVPIPPRTAPALPSTDIACHTAYLIHTYVVSVCVKELRLIQSQWGRLQVASGCRVLTGGEGGVMKAAQRGARAAAGDKEGDSVAVLRRGDGGGGDGGAAAALLRANRWADVRIPRVCSGCGAGMGYIESLTRIHSGKCHFCDLREEEDCLRRWAENATESSARLLPLNAISYTSCVGLPPGSPGCVCVCDIPSVRRDGQNGSIVPSTIHANCLRRTCLGGRAHLDEVHHCAR